MLTAFETQVYGRSLEEGEYMRVQTGGYTLRGTTILRSVSVYRRYRQKGAQTGHNMRSDTGHEMTKQMNATQWQVLTSIVTGVRQSLPPKVQRLQGEDGLACAGKDTQASADLYGERERGPGGCWWG